MEKLHPEQLIVRLSPRDPPNRNSSKETNGAHRILVVEDDPVGRSLLQFALEKKGYDVTTAENAAGAREHLAPKQMPTFHCVVTDYRMPEDTGLDLLAWIRERDPSLATIIITAESEKHLVTKSFRHGAIDFLDKPIDLDKLNTAVERAVLRTLRDRRLAQSEAAVKDLGNAQAWMLGAEAVRRPVNADLYFHPRHEAGGDFFSRFHPAHHQHLFLLTDVSGHDPQAAYVSAYFHGVARGMLTRGAPVEEIFAHFNQFLVEEWNREERVAGRLGIPTSIGVCAITIDTDNETATVENHGMPAPIFWLPDGNAVPLGETGGFPLGWFADFSSVNIVQSIKGGGSFSLWTDGLEEMAAAMKVSEFSLAWALRRAKSTGQRLPELDRAGDDLLLADIYLTVDRSTAETFRPLILEQYHGGQGGAIDEMQASWRRNLNLAAPELHESTLHDILLASREALLNALKHGCGLSADHQATFQVSYCPAIQTVRVRVCDPGAGHRFDLKDHEERAAGELAEKHRGLILIKHLASKANSEHNGARLTLDFTSPEKSQSSNLKT